MSDRPSRASIAFVGSRCIARGPVAEILPAIHAAAADGREPTMLFDVETGNVVELDLRGSPDEALRRIAEGAGEDVGAAPAGRPATPRGRGRPRLGVVSREVTLLPRHWDWLAAQPGGASQALRRLVDEARREDGGTTARRTAREAAYRFMSAMAGNLPGFEEASRALFAGDGDRFREHTSAWPEDVRRFAEERAFEAPTTGGA
ncbi:MAG: DUF2239 family protein [Pseudomonadales bacterium]